MVELGSKALMRYFIKRIAVVQHYIDLLASVESCGQIMHCKKQLGLTGSLFPETVPMHMVAQYLVAFHEVHKEDENYYAP